MGDDRDVLRTRSQLGEYLGGVVGLASLTKMIS